MCASQSDSTPIGVPSVPWGQEEKRIWRSRQTIRRSYASEVCTKLDALAEPWQVTQYGHLGYDDTYPLFAAQLQVPQSGKPNILITGGVHGYETSGVQGALKFMATVAEEYAEHFNLIVLPCISPWGYETINRWNPHTVDPNRSFKAGGLASEATQAMAFVQSLGVAILAHLDLHETTDTDNTEFRPALFARDGLKPHDLGEIPDGFYLVDDVRKSTNEFQAAIIRSVERVTHIAPADEQGKLIGVPIRQRGVIQLDVTRQGLCSGFSGAPYTTTTEVYPDSDRVTPDVCNDAQVAAITGALNYLLAL